LVPVVLGAFVATVNAPIAIWLRRRRIPLWLTVALALLVDSLFLGAFVALLTLAIAELSSRLPEYVVVMELAEIKLSGYFRRLGMEGTLFEVIDPADAIGLAASLFGEIAGLFWNVSMALIIAAFLLWRLGRPSASGGRPAFGPSGATRRAAREMNRYVVIKTATSVVTGLSVGVFSWVIGGDLPILFGLLAFLLNYIPNVGSFIAAVPAVALGLLHYGPQHALALTLGYLLINVVIGNVIEPRVMGRALGLWPVVVLLSVIFWGWILGIVGAVLSALLTLVVKILLLSSEDLRPIGLALGPRAPRRSGQDLVEEAMPPRRAAPAGPAAT
jgi:predicted PurR-regulated permease PerM